MARWHLDRNKLIQKFARKPNRPEQQSVLSLANRILGREFGQAYLDRLLAASSGIKSYDPINAQMLPGGFDFYARKILRLCATIPSQSRRLAYFERCIENAEAGPVNTDLAWDVLDDFELRALSDDDFDTAYREAKDATTSATDKIVARVGDKLATSLFEQLFKATTLPTDATKAAQDRMIRRRQLILENAAKATTKNPTQYLRACIRDERKRMKKPR